MFEDNYVYRLDPTLITDFSKGLRTYMHTPDWTGSGVAEPDAELPTGWQKTKALFAGGDMQEIAPYVVPRDIRWLWRHDPDMLYFDNKDRARIENNRTWLSTFDASDFEYLAQSGEYISKNPPSKPLKQQLINDPVQFMQDNGYEVMFVDDLDDMRRELDAQGIDYNSEGFEDD